MFLLTGADLYFDISVIDRCHVAMIGMRCVGCNILSVAVVVVVVVVVHLQQGVFKCICIC